MPADEVGAHMADDFGPQMDGNAADIAWGPSGVAEPAAPASAGELSER